MTAPGQGKSTLVAALARSELADDLLPKRFLHALAFASPATLEADLAGDLSGQLALTVDGFPAAAGAFQAQTPADVLLGLGPLEQLLGALGLLAPTPPVRLAVDGLDQLTPQAAPPIHAALRRLANDPQLRHVRLLVSARPDATLPPGAVTLELDRVDAEHLERYLRRRGVPAAQVPLISQQAEGNWLVARLLADLAVDGDLPVGQLPVGLQDAYRQELRRAGSADPNRWVQQLRPVLAVLAAAGVGPVLPIALLCGASGRLGGPQEPARVRDVLVQLRGLVVRGAPGTPQEQLGVFHTTFADYLLTDPEVGLDPPEVHAALADAIAQAAPMDDHDPEDPLHGYAATAEAEHLWQAGRQEQALASIYARESHIPAENLARLVAWYPSVWEAFGPDHPSTLSAQYRLALHTSQAGKFAEALRLFREVLSARQRVLGPNHPDTLATRHEIALCTGETGDPDEALRLFRQLLPDRERILGPDDPHTLFTRHEIAYYTGETGDPDEALRLYRQVLADRARVLGPDDPNTLATRHEVAYYTSKTGEPAKALDLFVELLPNEERILGADHPTTLATRANIARLLGETGNKAEALRRYRLVLADMDRILGPEHPHTETIRQAADSLRGQLGEADV